MHRHRVGLTSRDPTKCAPVEGVARCVLAVVVHDCWDAMCRTVLPLVAAGAMLGGLSSALPTLSFIDAKRDPLRLRNFNMSSVSDAFITALTHRCRLAGCTFCNTLAGSPR